MNEVLTYQAELVVETCWCGMRHAVPRELVNHQRHEHEEERPQPSIYCPLGHEWIRRDKSKVSRLREELTEIEAQLMATQDQLAAANREAARQRKRAAAGVCPCCKRSFVQLGRHMKNQHPDYASTP